MAEMHVPAGTKRSRFSSGRPGFLPQGYGRNLHFVQLSKVKEHSIGKRIYK